jgi:hypothetical protein
MKVPLFVGHGFSHDGGENPHVKFSMMKEALSIYRIMPRMLSFSA